MCLPFVAYCCFELKQYCISDESKSLATALRRAVRRCWSALSGFP
uniref:Uncharacterized protein n=1 Tax=Arundo donax TaxID=35708 RepID=A0A0A8YQW3_ARUDO